MTGQEVKELIGSSMRAMERIFQHFTETIDGIDRRQLHERVNGSLTMMALYLGNIGEILGDMETLEDEDNAWEDV